VSTCAATSLQLAGPGKHTSTGTQNMQKSLQVYGACACILLMHGACPMYPAVSTRASVLSRQVLSCEIFAQMLAVIYLLHVPNRSSCALGSLLRRQQNVACMHVSCMHACEGLARGAILPDLRYRSRSASVKLAVSARTGMRFSPPSSACAQTCTVASVPFICTCVCMHERMYMNVRACMIFNHKIACI
jgi:hypothetical protein